VITQQQKAEKSRSPSHRRVVRCAFVCPFVCLECIAVFQLLYLIQEHFLGEIFCIGRL
jgi:hypothetical protein